MDRLAVRPGKRLESLKHREESTMRCGKNGIQLDRSAAERKGKLSFTGQPAERNKGKKKEKREVICTKICCNIF